MIPLEHPDSKNSIKMATSTDMKGNVVKMEVDYSETVDKRIPECEALAAVCNSRFLLALLSWQYYLNFARVALENSYRMSRLICYH